MVRVQKMRLRGGSEKAKGRGPSAGNICTREGECAAAKSIRPSDGEAERRTKSGAPEGRSASRAGCLVNYDSVINHSSLIIAAPRKPAA